MKRTTEFSPADRYLYDFKVLTMEKGWAQFDSAQDASYFGNWINPFERKWFTYCEGDCTLVECDDDAEFCQYVRETFAWYANRDGKRPGIDPGFNAELKRRFASIGLGDLLH